MSSLFSGISEVKPMGRGKTAQYFDRAGRLQARIISARAFRSTKPATKGQPQCVVEFEIVKVTDGDYSPGEVRTFFKSLQGEYNLRDVQSLVAAAMDVDPSSVTEDICDEMFYSEADDGKCEFCGKIVEVVVSPNPKGETDKYGNLYHNTYFNASRSGAGIDAGF